MKGFHHHMYEHRSSYKSFILTYKILSFFKFPMLGGSGPPRFRLNERFLQVQHNVIHWNIWIWFLKNSNNLTYNSSNSVSFCMSLLKVPSIPMLNSLLKTQDVVNDKAIKSNLFRKHIVCRHNSSQIWWRVSIMHRF